MVRSRCELSHVTLCWHRVGRMALWGPRGLLSDGCSLWTEEGFPSQATEQGGLRCHHATENTCNYKHELFVSGIFRLIILGVVDHRWLTHRWGLLHK